MFRLHGFLALVALMLCASAAVAQARIAVASSVRYAMEDIAATYARETGRSLRIAYGSSGNFVTQVEQGAPFELLLAADEESVLRLAAAGRAQDRGVLYAAGRLVLFAPQGSPVGVDERLEGLRAAVSKGLVRRFAIANPQHAPYGRAAEEALRAAGLWEPLQSKLVLGENVAQAAQFSTTGAAQAGIFAYSLVLEPAIAKAGRHVLLPEKLHAPLRQRMALLKGAGEAARQFYAYLQSPATRERFRRHGFPMPDG